MRVREAMEAYKLCKIKKDGISQRLIELMDNEIKVVFEEAFGSK